MSRLSKLFVFGSGAILAATTFTTQASAAGQSPVTITYSNWQDSVTEKIIQSIANQFHKLHPNITVQLVDIPTSYTQKLTTLAAGSDLYDVFDIGDAQFYQFAKSGLLQDMSSVYKLKEMNQSDLFPAIYNLTLVNGTPMALPQTHNTMLIYYNADLFKKAGLPNPQVLYQQNKWTWAAFLNAAQKISNLKGSKQYYGYLYDPSWWGGYYGWISSNGGAPFNSKGLPTFSSPQTRQALQFLYDGTKSGAFTVDSMLPKGVGVEQLFSTGTVGMMYTGRWSLQLLHNYTGSHWDVVPIPKAPRGHYGATIPWANIAVNAHSPHLKEAMEWAAFFASAKSMKQFVGWQGLPPQQSLNYIVTQDHIPPHAEYFNDVVKFAVSDATWPTEMSNPSVFTTLQQSIDALLVGAKTGSTNVDQATSALDQKLSSMIK